MKETQHKRAQNKNRNEHNAQIRAMQHKTSVQYTSQGDPAQEDTAQNKQNAQTRAIQRAGKRLKDKGKMTIRDSGDDTTGAPLTVEEATTASRPKSLKKDGQMESQTRLYPSDHRSSARTNSTETEVIAGMPDKIFTEVQQIHKDPWGDNQLIRAEAEKNMWTKKSRTHEGKTEQQ